MLRAQDAPICQYAQGGTRKAAGSGRRRVYPATGLQATVACCRVSSENADPCRQSDGPMSKNKRISARRSAIHGNGVFALAPIRKGEQVLEYKGRRRTHAEVDASDSGDVESGHTFLFTLNDEYVIDANFEGNSARWINHSCDPNCEAVLDEHEGGDRRRDRVFIETIRAIRPGEELTYNYGITLDEPHTARLKKVWACRCGARKCTGTMLQPKRGKR
jgi:uncharacterized protein